MTPRVAIALFVVVSLMNCTGIQQARKIDSMLSRETEVMELNRSWSDSVNIRYIGCGGFYIESGEDALLIDPYFSTVGPLLFLPFKRIKTDTHAINNFFERHLRGDTDQYKEVKAILTTHGHYDHIYDIPYILQHQSSVASSKVFVSNSSFHMLRGAGITENQMEIVDQYLASGDRPGKWLQVGDRIKVLPIQSTHPPHTKLFSMYKGNVEKNYHRFWNKPGKWKEGPTYAYLIDFLDQNGQTVFRISVQSSASPYPHGRYDIWDEAYPRVDVMLLLVASFQNAKDFPERVINTVRPEHVVLCHWENFFRPFEEIKRQPRTVPLTNVPLFLEQLKTYALPEGFTVPLPETKVQFLY